MEIDANSEGVTRVGISIDSSDKPSDFFEDSKNTSNIDQNTPPFDAYLKHPKTKGFSPSKNLSNPNDRSKTSLRLRYEAEVRVIRRQLGSLEQVREELGLSRRKMCQLLMVDPSAWTRWMKDESRVPPHIWRSLQWYMALIDKTPSWHPQNSFGAAPTAYIEQESHKMSSLKEDLEQKVSQMKDLPQVFERQMEERLSALQNENQKLVKELQKQAQIGASWKLLVLINLLILAGWMVLRA